MEQERDWAVQVAADVGKRVAYYRERASRDGRKMTAQALADRCAELGLPIGRVAIAKLENGLREKVSLPEVLVLAVALGIPPMLLVFPFGMEDKTEVVPGVPMPTLVAAYWFFGYFQMEYTPDGVVLTGDANEVIRLYEEHSALGNLLQNPSDEVPGGQTPEEALIRRDERSAELRHVRAMMRERGLLLPELPPDLAHIDVPPKGPRPKAPGPPWRLTSDGHKTATTASPPSFDERPTHGRPAAEGESSADGEH